jgi:hypothetical protein
MAHSYIWSIALQATQTHITTYPVETLDLRTRRILADGIRREIDALKPLLHVGYDEDTLVTIRADLAAAIAMLKTVRVPE